MLNCTPKTRRSRSVPPYLEHLLLEWQIQAWARPREWRNRSIRRILGDGKEEEHLFEFVRTTGVGLRAPGEIVEEDNGDWRDRLNELVDFMQN